MAVQDAQAPGAEDEESSAGKENPHVCDRQLTPLSLETSDDQREDLRREQNAEQDENRNNQRENGEYGTGDASRFLLVVARAQPDVYRDERRRERALTEQILEQVRDADRRVEGIGGGARTQVGRDERLSNDAENLDNGEIYKLELNGTIVGKFGRAGRAAKEFNMVNAIDCRNENELLVGELGNWRVQRIVLKK